MKLDFRIPVGDTRADVLSRCARVIAALPADKPLRIEVSEFKPRRTLSQNATLWMIYDQILNSGGEELRGWDKDDLHQFFLIDKFGSDVREVFGKKRHVPLRRSSSLNKQEFSDLMDHVVRFMAERGVMVYMPGELG